MKKYNIVVFLFTSIKYKFLNFYRKYFFLCENYLESIF
ncbi:hypothetical protein EU95_0896 [Prochlorococcus marinus str. MIT 9201]|uniref:Uncharacterized protein n=1 Tax=Prochlorococcus marinus str. MIT 9201 TaxID=93057 RepID=A0A0A2A5L6_PROMR|nr:hypothetical protein EU95_0896 [Prochlorococcus marinus str. MIT 9201]